MPDSLFSALRKYAPSPDRDPLEDFITEALAWLLRRHEDLSWTFLEQVAGIVPDDGTVEFVTWETQVSFEGGRLDMAADLGETGVIFEHKTWSQLAPGQLAKYRAYGEKTWPAGNKVVLITGQSDLHGQDPDKALTWTEVREVLSAWVTDSRAEDSLVKDFAQLLDEQGLGQRQHLTPRSLLSYYPAQSVVPTLCTLVRHVEKRDWSLVKERIGWPDGSPKPRLRWGAETHTGTVGSG